MQKTCFFFAQPTDARFAFDHAFAIKGQGTVLTGARVPDEMGPFISRAVGGGRWGGKALDSNEYKKRKHTAKIKS